MDTNVHNRIKEVRQHIGLTQTEFGSKLGVSRSVIVNIELEKVAPKPQFINHICEVFNLRREWLTDGQGDMLNPQLQLMLPSNSRDKVKEIISIYRQLNPDLQEYLYQQVEALLDLQKAMDEKEFN